MPRYEVRNTSNNARSIVEGENPQDLMRSVPAGTYRPRVMAAQESTDIVVPQLTAAIAQTALEVGNLATLTTNAPVGSTYQWRLGGVNISGATSPTYLVSNTGNLTCLVSIPGNPQPAVETAAVTVGGSSLAPTSMVTSVTDPLTGHVYNFSKAVQAGQYWNGEWFVVADPTALITSVTPVGVNASGQITNGLVRNPFQGNATTSQGWDNRTNSQAGGTRGPIAYDPTLNIDPDITGLEVALTEGSYVKGESYASAPGDTRIKAYSVLTVVPSVPLANAFRPGIRAASKVLAKTTANIDWSLRRNIPGFQPVADLTSNISNLKRLQWTWRAGNEPARGYGPGDGIGVYGASWGDSLGGRMLAFHGDYSQAQLEETVHAIVQIGIDLISGAQDGLTWGMEEGHHIFRKFPALMAALLLDDADMKAAVNWNLLPRAFGNDDNAHYYITQTLIDNSPTPNSKTSYPYPYTQDHLGMPEWGSAVESDSSDGIAEGRLSASYRVLNGLRHFPGIAWVYGTAGAEALCNPAMLDYGDRLAEILRGHYTDGLYSTTIDPPFFGNWNSTPFGATTLANYNTLRAFSARPTFVNVPEEMGAPALTANGNGTVAVGINAANAFLSPRASVSAIQSYQLRWRPITNLTGTTSPDASIPWQVITGISSLPYTLTGVPGNTTIRAQIRAVNAQGTGVWLDDSPRFADVEQLPEWNVATSYSQNQEVIVRTGPWLRKFRSTINGANLGNDPLLGTGWSEEFFERYARMLVTHNTNTAPQAVRAPIVQLAILGQGQTATADPGIWVGNPSAVTLTYQWQRSTNGGGSWSNISGATSQTYTTASADVGNQIRCAVTGTNSTGATTVNTGARAISASPTTTFQPAMTTALFRPIWHYASKVYQGDGFVFAETGGSALLAGEDGAIRLNEIAGANFDGIADVDVLMEYELSAVNRADAQIILRGGGDNNEQGYIIGYTRGTTASSTDFLVDRLANGVRTRIATFDIGGAGFPANSRRSMRVQAEGTTLRLRDWVTGQAEPGTWNLTVTDATYASGFIGSIIPQQTFTRIYRFDVTPLGALPAAATGGADLDLSFAEGTPTVSVDLLQNWSLNGRTLTLVGVSPALPSGLTVSSAGLLTRTGTVSTTADATYTLTMEDEFGRQVSDTFTLEITAAASFNLADLFTGGTVGAWFDGTDPTTMNTATDGTGSQPASGQNIRRIVDKSGLNVVATNANAFTFLDTDENGNHFISIANNSSAFNFTGGWAANSPIYIAVAGRTLSTTDNDGFVTIGPATNFQQRGIGILNGSTLKVDVRNGNVTLATSMSTLSVFEGKFDAPGGTTISAAVNGGSWANNSSATIQNTSTAAALLRGLTGNAPELGRVYGVLILNRHPSESERASIIAAMQALYA